MDHEIPVPSDSAEVSNPGLVNLLSGTKMTINALTFGVFLLEPMWGLFLFAVYIGHLWLRRR